jgi:hypothetical protein
MRIRPRRKERTPAVRSTVHLLKALIRKDSLLYFGKNFLRRLIMKHLQKHLSASLIALAALLAAPMAAWAATAPDLGTAGSFAALGGTGVTCTSPIPPITVATTVSGGDVGSGTVVSSVTGFPGYTPGANECSLSGNILINQTAAMSAVLTAYNAVDTNNPCPTDAAHNLSGEISNGGTAVLSPGVYCFSGVATLTGTLTLDLLADSGGDGSGVWIFKGTSITPINGSVVMANGGNACNVYWRLGTTAVFDGATHFVGNVLAGTGISFTGTTGSSLNGRALAQSLVSMTGGNISACSATSPPPPPPPPPHCDGDHDGHDGDHDGHDGDHDGHDGDHDGHDGDHDGHDGDHDGHDGDHDGHHSGYHNNPFGSNHKHDNKHDNK